MQAELFLLKEIIFGEVEKHLDQTGTGYLVLEKVSIADLFIFHELVNATTIAQIKPDADQFPNLVKWYHDIEGIPQVQLGIEKFMNQFERLDD